MKLFYDKIKDKSYPLNSLLIKYFIMNALRVEYNGGVQTFLDGFKV